MQRTGENPGQDFTVLIVMVVVIWGAIAIAILASGSADTRTSSEKAADKIVEDSAPEPERICLNGDEYVISSKCP